MSIILSPVCIAVFLIWLPVWFADFLIASPALVAVFLMVFPADLNAEEIEPKIEPPLTLTSCGLTRIPLLLRMAELIRFSISVAKSTANPFPDISPPERKNPCDTLIDCPFESLLN